MSEVKEQLYRQLTGEVTSTKMDKTVVVKIERLVRHKVYKKQYSVSKKYKAHDEKNECQVGDVVVIQVCRPLSKFKKWRFIKKVK